MRAHRDNAVFEDEVRRIARALWPSAEFGGAEQFEGREFDGSFVTEDCIHLMEATISRRKEKARQDIEKLDRRIQTESRRGTRYRSLRGWFITKDEPTAEQRGVAKPYRDHINVLSFSQFQARLIDSHAYLAARDNHSFGSVRDPVTGEHKTGVEYVPLDLVKLDTLDALSRDALLSMLTGGSTLVLLGDFGAGKSMTLREVYRDLRKRHLRGETSTFPVYLNLRDHYGQTDPAEVIQRHGASIGFAHPSHLVRAWRAGYTHLLIDGFDEISTINIQGLWRNLRQNRFRAMEAVRRLVRDHPSSSGLLVAGRAHFFDSHDERRNALGLPNDAVELSLAEFTDQQTATYLERVGLRGFVPPWLPTRPLLVGYLAARGSLDDLIDGDSTGQPLNRAIGWDTLLDRISSREAEIEAGIDGNTVRRILERLATKARASESGLGSLSPESVIKAFNEVCGYDPDERGMVLLQRLPGLGVDRADENTRTFVDHAFADSCRAGDLIEFVKYPYDFDESISSDMVTAVGNLGIEVTAHRVTDMGYSEGQLHAAVTRAKRSGDEYLASDVARLIVECGFDIRENITITGVMLPGIDLDTTKSDMSRMDLRDCYFSRVEIDPSAESERLPSFHECVIDEVDGRVSHADLPHGMFDECIIDRFSTTAATTATVLSLDLPLGVRVCLTVLKKLYEQRGAGRKENALHRGLDGHARRLVPDVLHVLQGAGLAVPDRSRGAVIWRPDRSNRARVGRMMSAPASDNDRVLRDCSVL